ncbi:uncharacterized protein BJ212DRAFT_1296715 [Suillus subaureus]|uniref:Uncharacterized protein n=1 Tax=Suillus subaureus TaxID=48587 RepID=A0A9P7EJV2_9AGAM|nr:uncharacterized protein BJ212DRAFT_1296715 [Suillus subaureus]KAG1822744.1 hypothetical protein BJ212DRAFT_1296715 [Suillus subaureus]
MALKTHWMLQESNHGEVLTVRTRSSRRNDRHVWQDRQVWHCYYTKVIRNVVTIAGGRPLGRGNTPTGSNNNTHSLSTTTPKGQTAKVGLPIISSLGRKAVTGIYSRAHHGWARRERGHHEAHMSGREVSGHNWIVETWACKSADQTQGVVGGPM